MIPLPGNASDAQRDWIKTVRTMHRNKRSGGYIGCAFGAAMILASRYLPDRVPEQLFWVGLAVIGASWLVFVFVMISKWQWVKNNPFPKG